MPKIQIQIYNGKINLCRGGSVFSGSSQLPTIRFGETYVSWVILKCQEHYQPTNELEMNNSSDVHLTNKKNCWLLLLFKSLPIFARSKNLSRGNGWENSYLETIGNNCGKWFFVLLFNCCFLRVYFTDDLRILRTPCSCLSIHSAISSRFVFGDEVGNRPILRGSVLSYRVYGVRGIIAVGYAMDSIPTTIYNIHNQLRYWPTWRFLTCEIRTNLTVCFQQQYRGD